MCGDDALCSVSRSQLQLGTVMTTCHLENLLHLLGLENQVNTVPKFPQSRGDLAGGWPQALVHDCHNVMHLQQPRIPS